MCSSYMSSRVISVIFDILDSLDPDEYLPPLTKVVYSIKETLIQKFEYVLTPSCQDFQPVFTVATLLDKN